MVAPDSGSEQIRYDILIEAKVAIATLKEMYATMQNNSEKVLDFSKVLLTSSKAWNISLQETANIYRQINAQMAPKGGSLFGNTGGKDLITESQQVAQSYIDSGRAAQGAAPKVKQLGDATKTIPPAANAATNAMNKFGNTTLGILTARLILGALNLVKQFFQDSLKYAQDARSQMVQLNFAESVLSKRGMDITREELDKFIADIEAKYKYLSNLEATKVVSETAGAVAEFDVSKKQLGELADAIAFIQTKNKLLGQQEADAAHIINAAMDARSNFFNGMGINITEAIVKEKAYALGLAKSGEELTKQQRFQAVLALLTEQTAGKQQELIDALEGTPLGDQMMITKLYNDSLEKVGSSLLHIKDSWNSFITDMAKGDNNIFEGMVRSIEMLSLGIQAIIELGDNLADAYRPARDIYLEMWGTSEEEILKKSSSQNEMTKLQALFMKGNENWNWEDFVIDSKLATGAKFTREEYERLKEVLQSFSADEIESYFPDPTKIVDRFTRELVMATLRDKKLKNPIDKGELDNIPAPEILEEDQAELQKALEKMNEEILQSQIKLEQDMREVAIDLGRAMVDITKEYAQKRADAERDYANKISDINRNYAEKIASIETAQWEARQQARVDEEQREREFQNKMQELKEKFLMDLDDALHERNARQILKLIKQYNLDKTQMERQHAIEEQNARETERIQQESFERQKQAAQEARDRELEDVQIDFERKMEELKIQEDREVEAAVLKANRKLQDLERENLDRNTLIAAGLVNDFNLTQSMLGQIDQLFTDHYGYVTGVYQAMMAMLSQPIQLGAVTTSGTTTGTLPPAGGIGGTENPGMGGSNASSDMRSKFGGLSKLPIISRTKMDTNRVFSGMGGNGRSGRDGALTIDLTLSPDLEARVVKNTMDKTADVITRVRRTK